MRDIFERDEPEYVKEAFRAFDQVMVGDDYSVLKRIARISQGENFVLKILLKSDGPVSPTYLSQTINTTKGRISSILKTLEKKGEIVREVDRDNRRNVLITLTEAGRERITSELESSYDMMVKAFKSLGEEEVNEAVRLLNKLVAAMNDNK